MAEQQVATVDFATKPTLFGRWSYDDVKIVDPCFKDYIALQTVRTQVFVPHTAGRYQRKKFRKALCPVVERLAGGLMFHGRNTGKKTKAITIIKQAFEIIHLLTGRNPLAVFADAVQKGGPREDFTKLGSGGVVRAQAVDVSPMRRVNQAIHLMTKGARERSIKTIRTVAECLADEIMACEKQDGQKSYTIRKRDELEKVAKGNR